MGTGWLQYDFKFRHRQQWLKEIQGSEWVLIFSWLGALVLSGFTWWAAYRLLFDIAQLLQFIPRLLP
jgi:hypothetical protein